MTYSEFKDSFRMKVGYERREVVKNRKQRKCKDILRWMLFLYWISVVKKFLILLLKTDISKTSIYFSKTWRIIFIKKLVRKSFNMRRLLKRRKKIVLFGHNEKNRTILWSYIFFNILFESEGFLVPFLFLKKKIFYRFTS